MKRKRSDWHFLFFRMEGALNCKKEPKKGLGNAERNRVPSHGMDPRVKLSI